VRRRRPAARAPDTRRLGGDEPVTVDVEGPGGCSRVVGPRRQGTHLGEPRDGQRREPGLRAAREDHVAGAGAQQVTRDPDGRGTRGAGRGCHQVRAECAELHRQLPGHHVRHQHGDEHGADLGRPVGEHLLVLALPGRGAAHAAADHHADARPVPRLRIEPGVGDGLAGGHDRQLHEPVQAARRLAPEQLERVEAGHAARHRHRHVGQRGIGRRQTLAGQHACPAGIDADAGGRDQPEARDRDGGGGRHQA
jgi:hypothetical protein